MNSKNKQINGYILAGGKSSRMGNDKGLLLIEGKPMIQYVIEQMQAVFEKIVIVSSNQEYEKFGLEVIPDLIKDIGPAGGIYTALHHSEAELNFIMSCDTPFVTQESIQFILDQRDNFQIVLIENKGKMEPLFGIYSKECEANWLQLIKENKIKLMDIVLQFNLKIIRVDNNETFGESFFRNINTKDDYTNAIQSSAGF